MVVGDRYAVALSRLKNLTWGRLSASAKAGRRPVHDFATRSDSKGQPLGLAAYDDRDAQHDAMETTSCFDLP